MTLNTKKVIVALVIMIVAVLSIIFVPFGIIWALNTLFPVLSIPYTFWTWLAVIILNVTWLYKPTPKVPDTLN